MMATKAQKALQISKLNDRAQVAQLMVIAKYEGLSVSALTELRRSLRAKGGEFSIYKNTLAKIASKGTRAEILDKDFRQAVGILIVREEKNAVGALKAFVDYAKTNPTLSIKAGVFEGQRLEAPALTELSRIPDRATLYAQLLGLLSSPLAKTTQGLNQVVQKLVYGLSEYSKSKG
uniref:Large ribosomal subunit protein uL10 n=1 Tax=Leptospirillum ferriphilum TaxID=178606 RepID=A0A7C3QVT4_9BACT